MTTMAMRRATIRRKKAAKYLMQVFAQTMMLVLLILGVFYAWCMNAYEQGGQYYQIIQENENKAIDRNIDFHDYELVYLKEVE